MEFVDAASPIHADLLHDRKFTSCSVRWAVWLKHERGLASRSALDIDAKFDTYYRL
jgi:hypothetical protein